MGTTLPVRGVVGAAGEDRVHHLALGQQALADGGVDILRILGLEFLQHAVERLVGEVVADPA